MRLIFARTILFSLLGCAFCLTLRLALAEAEFRLDGRSALQPLVLLSAANLVRSDSSRNELSAAVRMNPRLSSAWIQLGLEAESTGNVAEAEADLLQAARVDHLYLPAWTLANFYFRHDDARKFWPWAERAARLTSDDYRPLLRLADYLDTSPQSVATRLGGGGPLLRAYLDLLIGAGRLDSARDVAGLLAERHDPADRERLAAFAERLK